MKYNQNPKKVKTHWSQIYTVHTVCMIMYYMYYKKFRYTTGKQALYNLYFLYIYSTLAKYIWKLKEHNIHG
jgi:hypothetical protein